MKFERYILKQLLVGFTLAVGGMLFVALPGIAVAAVHKLSGVDLVAILKFLPFLGAGLVPYVVPIGFLLSVVVTYGRLAADNEWTAMIMAGRNPLRMVLPTFLFGFALSVGTYFMVADLLPYLKFRTKAYQIQAISDVVRNLSPGRTEIDVGHFYMSAGFREGDVFLDTLISIPEKEHKVLAEKVWFTFTEAEMYIHVENYRLVFPSWKGVGEENTFTVALEKLLDRPNRKYSGSRYKRSSELMGLLEDPELADEVRRDYLFAVHSRFATASTILMFMLLGVSTGLILRRGTQLAAMAVAVGYALTYYILSMRLGKELARSGAVPSEVSAWMTTAVGTLIGLYFLRKALRT